MEKTWKIAALVLLSGLLILWGSLLGDRQQLSQKLIRLHVVANSDSQADQQVKLRVRDAIVSCLQPDLAKVSTMDQAKAHIAASLPKLRSVAQQVLRREGFQHDVQVTLCREPFSKRHYDTFSLPAGVYQSLRITIGQGAGRNWWCVAFPSLCLPATSQGFQQAAVEAGLTEGLTDTLSQEEPTLRFFLLDILGQLENRWFDR